MKTMENYNDFIKENWFKITNELGRDFEDGYNEDATIEIILSDAFEDTNLNLDICVNLLRLALGNSISFSITMSKVDYDSELVILLEKENIQYFWKVVDVVKQTLKEIT